MFSERPPDAQAQTIETAMVFFHLSASGLFLIHKYNYITAYSKDSRKKWRLYKIIAETPNGTTKDFLSISIDNSGKEEKGKVGYSEDRENRCQAPPEKKTQGRESRDRFTRFREKKRRRF